MRRANVISGIVLAAFGLVMIFAIIPWQIETAPPGFVSPRLVPYITMAVMVVLSVILIANNWRVPANENSEDKASPISRSELIALTKIGAVFALAITLYLLVSPLAAGAALLVVSFLVLGERRPLPITAISASILLAIWFLFYQVLGTAIT